MKKIFLLLSAILMLTLFNLKSDAQINQIKCLSINPATGNTVIILDSIDWNNVSIVKIYKNRNDGGYNLLTKIQQFDNQFYEDFNTSGFKNIDKYKLTAVNNVSGIESSMDISLEHIQCYVSNILPLQDPYGRYINFTNYKVIIPGGNISINPKLSNYSLSVIAYMGQLINIETPSITAIGQSVRFTDNTLTLSQYPVKITCSYLIPSASTWFSILKKFDGSDGSVSSTGATSSNYPYGTGSVITNYGIIGASSTTPDAIPLAIPTTFEFYAKRAFDNNANTGWKSLQTPSTTIPQILDFIKTGTPNSIAACGYSIKVGNDNLINNWPLSWTIECMINDVYIQVATKTINTKYVFKNGADFIEYQGSFNRSIGTRWRIKIFSNGATYTYPNNPGTAQPVYIADFKLYDKK